MLLADKIVAITGASEGIGAACALACARQGADVAINYLGDDAAAERVEQTILGMGRKCLRLKGDVADRDEAGRFVDATVAALGGLDVFVSNAGICPFHAFLDMPAEIFERTMRVNLHGAFYMVQAAANRMMAQGRAAAPSSPSAPSARWWAARNKRTTRRPKPAC